MRSSATQSGRPPQLRQRSLATIPVMSRRRVTRSIKGNRRWAMNRQVPQRTTKPSQPRASASSIEVGGWKVRSGGGESTHKNVNKWETKVERESPC